jgi:hypothetical protein
LLATDPLYKYLLTENTSDRIGITFVHPVKGLIEGVAYPSNFVGSRGDTIPSWEWQGEADFGDCGCFVIGQAKGGYAIVGMISYTKKSTFGFFVPTLAGCSIFMQNTFASLVPKEPFVDTVLVALPAIQDLSDKSQLRNVISSYITPVGTVEAPSRSFKTKFQKTRVFEQAILNVSKVYKPPKKLQGINAEGEYVSALKHTFKYINMHDFSTDRMKNDASDAFLRNLPFKGEILKPLSLDEAIFGKPEIGIDRVTFSTSCGRELKELEHIGNKFDLFEPCVGEYKFRMKSVFVKKVNELLADMQLGVLHVPRVDFTPKDELRPEEKVDDMKIRLFSVMDFVYNVVVRMYLMPLITFLLQRPFFSKCFGQMNAGSFEWHRLAQYLQSVGKKVIDIDFSAFDTSHNEAWFTVVGRFFMNLSLKLGYSESESMMVYYCIVSMRVQILRWMNDIAIKTKGMPSGSIITLIFNCIVNVLMMIMAFVHLTGRPIDEFFELVKTAVVGDDNISNISDKIIDSYNMITIRDLYCQWGYIATNAQKNGKLRPHMLLEEAQFVKRMFVEDSVLGFMAPLDEDSLWKCFLYADVDCGVTPEQRLFDLAHATQLEAFLHGHSFFLQFQTKLQVMFVSSGMGENFFPKLEYNDCIERYKNGTFRTYDA